MDNLDIYNLMESALNDIDINGNYIKESASLEDSYIFSIFNINKNLTDSMLKYIKGATVVTPDMIEEQLVNIRKSRISFLADRVLEAFDNGDIEIKVPSSIPYIVRKKMVGDKPKIVVSILVSNFTNVSKDGLTLDIAIKPLYVLMESAYVSLQYHLKTPMFNRNITLMRICCFVYTQMFMNILNREYSISLDIELHNQVVFSISKFFLEKVWECRNKSLVFNVAVSNIKGDVDTDQLALVNDQYESANINTIADLTDFIKQFAVRFKDMNIKYISQRYITTYYGPAVLGIDCVVYMFFVIINAMQGSFLMNASVIMNMLANYKDIKQFYPELSKIV